MSVPFIATSANKNEYGYLSCREASVAVALISPPEGGASIPTLLYFYYSIQTSAAEAAGTTIIIIIPAITAGASSSDLISDSTHKEEVQYSTINHAP